MSTAALDSPQSKWVVSRFSLLLAAVSVGFIILAELRGLRLFSPNSTDGFFSQVKYIGLLWSQNQLDYTEQPILAVHTLRYLIVYPWVFSWLNNLPSFVEAFLFLPILLTVALAKFKGRPYLVQLTIFLLPFGLSYRTVLTVIGIANLYLFFFSDRKEPWRLILSAIASFLSSGVALAWFIVMILNWRELKEHRFLASMLLFPAVGGLAAVLSHKIGFFGDSTIGYASNTGILGAIERNTIFVSYQVGDTARFMLYITILAVIIYFLHALSRLPQSARPLQLFFLSAASAFLFEGLGAIAFFMPVLWAISGAVVLPISDPTHEAIS